MRYRSTRIRTSNVIASAALVLSFTGAAAAQSQPSVVTLITGDRVILSGANAEALSIERASGREQVRFITQRVSRRPGERPHWYVIPEDAVPLLAADRLDARLFDVTLLVDFRYDDAHRDTLPLIATYPPRSNLRTAATAAGARSVPGARSGEDLPSIEGLSVSADKARMREVWSALVPGAAASLDPAGGRARALGSSALASEPIGKLWLDGLRNPVLDRSLPQIGAPAAWAHGYEGDGVVVAVLDSGVDDTHPDLADTVIVSRNFTGDPDLDETGHGTHVASIIAGSGAAQGGIYRGVAPRAQLLAGKVCDVFGCPESLVIAGMQWAVTEEGARIVNLSLAGPDTPALDPIEEAVNMLSADYEALFVVAAGNGGPGAATIESPGSAAAALTVGAVDRDDQIAFFSARGPTLGGGALKPDLTAPGVDIVAARAEGTLLGAPVGEAYVAVSGTSMSAPHVAGAAALLLQRHPSWGARELKSALMGSAAQAAGVPLVDQGAGRLEVPAALEASLLAEPPSVSFGVARWPHEDDEPLTSTVAIHNLGAATELSFELDVIGPGSVRPPSQMFIVTPPTLSLATGETGFVTLTVDTRLSAPDGFYAGRLLASDGIDRALAVPLAVTREEERYDWVIRHIDRSGAPTSDVIGLISGYDQPILELLLPEPGAEETTLRLPPGRYALQAEFYSRDGVEPPALLIAPNQLLDADRITEFDARSAGPVSVEAPSRGLEAPSVTLSWEVPSALGGLSSGIAFGTPEHGAVAFYGATVKPYAAELVAVLDARWVTPGPNPSALHAASWTERRRLPVGPIKAVDPRRHAVVQAHYAAPLTSLELVSDVGVGAYPDGIMGAFLHGLNVELPYRRTEHYYTNDESTRWVNDLQMRDEAFLQQLIIGESPARYKAGRKYVTRWNEPPFSPVLPSTPLRGDSISRQGDTLRVAPSMYGDRRGHVGILSSAVSVELYRDGEPVPHAEDDYRSFELPRERASYRLEVEMSQSMFELTTRAKTAWLFESDAPAGDEPVRLPLLTVRFDAELNELGQAPRRRLFRLPIEVARLDRREPRILGAPLVEVSYDDGSSWTEVSVRKHKKQWVALLEHPTDVEYASLRATVYDRDGSGVEQTLIRAYALDAGD